MQGQSLALKDVWQPYIGNNNNHYNNNFNFGLYARKILNADAVRPGGGKITLRLSRLPPPNHLLSNTLSKHAHYIAPRKSAEAKARNIT